MSKLKISIIGCGAIGSSLAKSIYKDFSKRAVISAVFDLDHLKAKQLSKKILGKDYSVLDLKNAIKRSDLIIEAASAKSSLEIARLALKSGCDVMVMSVGGILGHIAELMKLANTNKARLYVPSGAICGIDGVKAANLGKIKRAILTTYKNPQAFKGVKYIEEKGFKLESISQETVLFEGLAKEAVKFFPQNINVAAVLSLAGIGENLTKVKIVASPGLKKNVHEIRIESDAGNIITRTENVLHPDNPKTSFLAVLSAVANLKQILSAVKVGT